MKLKCINIMGLEEDVLELGKIYEGELIKDFLGRNCYKVKGLDDYYFFTSRFEVIKDDKPIRIKCIDNRDFFGDEIKSLKFGKIYDVISEDRGYYEIKNELGVIAKYFKSRFKEIKDEEKKEMVNKTMRIKCIDNKTILGDVMKSLELNKVYDVVKEDISGYVIINERGENEWFMKSRFEVVEDETNAKINTEDKIKVNINDSKLAVNRPKTEYTLEDIITLAKHMEIGCMFERIISQLAIPLALDDGLELLIDDFKKIIK